VDFGIAKATWQASRTRPGVVKGKYAYMSPEQVEGRSLDARSDIYSVGICAYELMTGLPLYRRDNVTEAMKEIRDGKPVHPEHHRPDIPMELLAVLKRALETSKDARYPSAASMQLDLERYLKAATGLATPQLLGDFLRSEAPRTNEGEILEEPKLEGAPQPEEPPSAPARSRAVAGVAVKGGTAPLSSIKQTVTPAYQSLPALGAGSNPAAPAVGSTSTDSGSAPSNSRNPDAVSSSTEDLTTPGRPLRAAERARTSSSSARIAKPTPAVVGFGDAADDDLTRRDARLQDPPSTSGEHPTTRSPKLTPPSGERPVPGDDKSTSPGERAAKSGQHERAARSGQHPARSGPFPGNPLGDHREVSDQRRAVPGSELTAMLSNPPLQAAPKRRWPFALIALLVLGGGAAAGYRFVLPGLLGGPRPPSDPHPSRATAGADLGTPLDLKPVGDAGEAGSPDAASRLITTSLPVQTSATLGVNTRPSGAKVFIDGEALEMLTPVRMQPITAGPHHVIIERVGYQPREVDVALRPGEHRVLDFELLEERTLDPAGGTTTTPPSTAKKKTTPTPRSTGSGFLTAKTVPWSRAYDGTRLLGETPLVDVPLIEGTHVITFVNPDHPPVKRRITVRVGEQTRLSFSLDE